MPPRHETAIADYAVIPLDPEAAAAIRSWEADAGLTDAGSVVVSFRSAFCPHCGDDAAPPPWSPSSIAAAALGLATDEPRTEQIVVRCACREPHAGRPLTEPFGCGRVWTVRFTWDAALRVSDLGPGPLPSPAELGFAARFDQLRAAELERVRSQAAGWSKVMAGLAGLLGAAQLFGGRETADQLAAPWPHVVGAFITVAVVLAAASSVLAGLAAYGAPSSVRLENTAATGGQAGALQQAVQEQISGTRPVLLAAAVTAAAAFVLAVLAAAAMWWAPLAG